LRGRAFPAFFSTSSPTVISTGTGRRLFFPLSKCDAEEKTETETIERALDAILAEHKRNQLVAEANERFVTSGITVKDVFGKLAK
jgi:hypothetical protein